MLQAQWCRGQCGRWIHLLLPGESQKVRIRDLGAQLDARRKERLDAHDDLTVTALYNVL